MSKTKGTIYGIIAAISYGTNPLGALSLYQEGIHVNSVLFYRYALAALVILMILFAKKESLKINKLELKIVSLLGLLFASSSLTLFTSFHYMDAGIASTLLFVYPIMVAVLMAVFFKEKISATTILSIALALTGISLLSNGGDGETLNLTGVILVLISSLTYAIYIVIINQSAIKMSVFKLTFYVLVFCVLTTVTYSLFGGGEPIQWLTTSSSWGYVWMLAIVPTVISLITMTLAVNSIGSTPTAIMGALEPLTAVIIGVSIFGEQLTINLVLGIFIILVSVILIIAGKSISFKFIQEIVHKGSTNLTEK
ncbi:protein of unknown function DUF6 transmembrane [Bacteroides coprosuis DSM 18011]|uniref:EamA domain-containing protein n=1 Tax=Bacteroides coprosuis DSM 18011 TaxID=679937 RepID=F3ZTA0_9BACE|nr:EamA family transporter [Bacteroides coprosuis]EGJ72268.1 protein of unknown function DUF6 transmembrane [Bacteroides coprosuis DSM 18011]